LTPDGLKRESQIESNHSITSHTGRKLNYITIAASIAVIPFVNMSSNQEQEYFSDGLSEELLNLLAKIPELRVTSRTSAFSFKGKNIKIADIGRELNVGHILEGSVRRSGTTVRITAQPIDVRNDTHIWSETWDRTLEDVFEIQDEIAGAVVRELRVRLLNDLPRVASTTPQAYSFYLQARHVLMQRSGEAFLQAESLLQQVLENLRDDPRYLQYASHAGLHLSDK